MIEKGDENESQRRKFGSRGTADVIRIAFGNKIISSGCQFTFQPSTNTPFFTLGYRLAESNNPTKDNECCHNFYLNDKCNILEMQYFMSCEEEDSMDNYPSNEKEVEKKVNNSSNTDFNPNSFLAIRVSPNKENGLDSYPNNYQQEEGEPKSFGKMKKYYVVVEMRNNEEFESILRTMKKSPVLSPFLKGKALSLDDTKKYAMVLKEDQEKGTIQRLESLRRRSKRKNNTSKSISTDDEILLVYPFPCPSQKLENTMEGLIEAGGSVCTYVNKKDVVWNNKKGGEILKEKDKVLTEKEIHPKLGRAHYLTVREEDFKRLEPKEFLNDTIIDFWMKWLV